MGQELLWRLGSTFHDINCLEKSGTKERYHFATGRLILYFVSSQGRSTHGAMATVEHWVMGMRVIKALHNKLWV